MNSAVIVPVVPPRGANFPMTVIRLSFNAASRSSRIWLITASSKDSLIAEREISELQALHPRLRDLSGVKITVIVAEIRLASHREQTLVNSRKTNSIW